MLVRNVFLAICLWASSTAHAGMFKRPMFFFATDLGAAGRYVESVNLTKPEGFGLSVGMRAELNLLAHLKVDGRYVEGTIFPSNEERYLDISASGRTPALFIFALDVHELYARTSLRQGDDLFYVMPGLGLVGNLIGTLKVTLGYTYINADNVLFTQREVAHGGFAGAEYLLRTKVIDLDVRAAFAMVWHDDAYFGAMLSDANLFVKIPVGPVAIGPRLDLAYRNLGLLAASGDLFGQRQEFTAHLGFAFYVGTGKGKSGAKGNGT